jgi:hypothetical protein
MKRELYKGNGPTFSHMCDLSAHCDSEEDAEVDQEDGPAAYERTLRD